MKFFERVQRIFIQRLSSLSYKGVNEFSEEQVHIILGCLFDALSGAIEELGEAMEELIEEVIEDGLEGKTA